MRIETRPAPSARASSVAFHRARRPMRIETRRGWRSALAAISVRSSFIGPDARCGLKLLRSVLRRLPSGRFHRARRPMRIETLHRRARSRSGDVFHRARRPMRIETPRLAIRLSATAIFHRARRPMRIETVSAGVAALIPIEFASLEQNRDTIAATKKLRPS